MRILMLHNHYLLRGGEDSSFETEVRLLRDFGCEVDCYEESNERVDELGALRTGIRSVWSPETYRRVRQRLREKSYDIVHIQNFFPLISPSAHYAAKAEGVPVVQALRNFRLLCPHAFFLRDGRICHDCIGKTTRWPGILHACYRDSRLASGAVAAMSALNQLVGTWSRMVDVYVAPTQVVRQEYVDAGFAPDRIMVKPNVTYPVPIGNASRRAHALFVGRLSKEKGVATLLTAWNGLTGIPLKIAGEGPLEAAVREAASTNQQIELLGWQSKQAVADLMAGSKFVVMPSEWYETFGRVIVESFGAGTPVIATNIGAMAELIEHGRTGLLYRCGDAADLATQVEWALENPDAMIRMGAEARWEFENQYSAERNYQQLRTIYDLALTRARS